MLSIHVLTARQNVSAPFYGNCFNLEDALVDSCGAKLIYPTPRDLFKRTEKEMWVGKAQIQSFLRKSVGLYQPMPESELSYVKGDLKILVIAAMNGAHLESLTSIPRWRERYDLVVAYIFDCWVAEALPDCIYQFDHLFVPFLEVQSQLADRFKIPVSVLPFGVDVRSQGSPRTKRSIDVSSYGRGCYRYHQALFETFNEPGTDLIYYVHPNTPSERFPQQPYGPNRRDYQHTTLLGKILRRSKAALAFSNTYTAKTESTINHHVSHRSEFPIFGHRWLEISAAGAAVLGRRPETSLVDQYLGWEDATIELPDNPQEGIEFICDLLADTDRMEAIHHRNYYENLMRNDWRHRIQVMLETLSIPMPQRLETQLAQMHDESQQALGASRGQPLNVVA